jgi:predicted GNAT superfamily acetyltransferase
MSAGTSDSTIRNVEPRDYERVLAVIDHWWSGRTMSTHLSRVFFEHFRPTSFIAERDGELEGFLLGFLSQTYGGEAYIHFVGVRPDARRKGLASALYERFFAIAHSQYCSIVRAVTSPANRTSIAFHAALGFRLERGDGQIDGVPVRRDYPVLGESRVLLVRRIGGERRQAGPGDEPEQLAS